MSPLKPRSITPRKKTTSLSTPQRDGGVHQAPTVNNLSRNKVIVSTADDDICMEESKTYSSSASDTYEYLSAQDSSTSESEPVHIETQDSTSNLTEVSELSESAGTTTNFTTPKRSRHARQYYVVTLGRKPGIYIDLDEYNRQIKGYENSKSEAFTTRKQAKTYLDE